jgi:predicted TIM-barrel fold metal-dependent hydrolase
VDEPCHPVIDAHNHLGRWLSDGRWMIRDVEDLLAAMDAAGVKTVVNLDGRWGRELVENLQRYDRAHPDRFVTFCHADWSMLASGDDPRPLIEHLQRSIEAGAKGLKVWKDLGLVFRDRSGALLGPDDERVIPVIRSAGAAGLPVLIHTADPLAFFQPLDRHNERLEELQSHPEWWFGGPEHPDFWQLLNAFERLVAACPDTTFIGAHVGNCSEDLSWVDRMLGTYTNFHVDLGGRMAELGRQPRAARRLITSHADRVLFGTDIYPVKTEDYRLWYRFMESEDECFDYAPGCRVPPQGRWQVSGLGLAPDVLAKVYYENARRLLGLGRVRSASVTTMSA